MRMVKTAIGCPEQQSLEASQARLDGVWSNLGSGFATLPAGQPLSRPEEHQGGSLSLEPYSIPGMHIPALGKGDFSISHMGHRQLGYCWFVLGLSSLFHTKAPLCWEAALQSQLKTSGISGWHSPCFYNSPPFTVLLSHLYPNGFHSSLEV